MTKSFPFIFIWLFALGVRGELIEITRDWTAPAELRRIRISGSSASTVFDPASGNYHSAKAHDGNRRQTKWVASEAPEEKAPQWIELHLPWKQKVSAVAVFGEAVGNDGIVDARLQVATEPDWFQTVGFVTNATSGSWLVRFPPVSASQVRLFITRSSGPSRHTDVYEVEVYGPKPTSTELKTEAEVALADGTALLRRIAATNHWWTNVAAAWFSSLTKTDATLRAHFQTLVTGFEQLEKQPLAGQEKLADEIASAMEELRKLAGATPKQDDTWEQRLTGLQTARALFTTVGDTVTEQRARNGVRLFNNRVMLQLNSDNTWNVVWKAKNDAAIFHAGFEVQVDGKQLALAKGRTEIDTFEDRLGKGKQIKESWAGDVRVERLLRIYDGNGAVTIFGTISNATQRAVVLDGVQPLIVRGDNKGCWQSGDMMAIPSAVFISGASEFQCTPGRHAKWGAKDEQAFSSTQVLNLTDQKSLEGFTAGFLSAFEARPDLNATFRAGQGGVTFSARQSYLGRRLDPGESLDFDPLYLCADDDAYAGLEKYADAAAHFAQQPVRKGATALWCSWYAHRMAVSEELVLSNAAVAAKHLKPLGFEIMQLDHGWQVGDVTGDWVPDQKTFPHGFKWLSQELQARYGLKLGVWIAPTDVAETSDAFRQHPEWMLKDGQGKPQVNWRWYWKPNPNCYELDASQAAAARWVEETFARLSADGVSYYKIDFIASSGGEHFVQNDPKATRGWSVLRKAMEAVRRGAGTNAWIRYCQPPPLLSAGLADSAYGGEDTLDAGLNGDIRVLRNNARSLAASYWVNDRLYHREVCDMSVRMQADVEEVRMRLALMTLAGCSISFSDEMQYLPPSRIRMMQACLPPGSPPMKPLDLFERTIPSVWHVHCQNEADEWDVVGLFNFENAPETRTIDFGRLGLTGDIDVVAFEFWEQKASVHRGTLTMSLPPQSSRIVALRRSNGHPQVVGTDLHLLQGYHELKQLSWDEKNLSLAGEVKRAPGLAGKLFVYLPANYTPHFEFPLNEKSARLTHLEGNLWACEVDFRNVTQSFVLPFDRK